jgi:hypothetical protein
MSYSKYYVYKEQTSTDGGASWQYTGNETPSGESIGTYSTLEECEGSGPTPPSPYSEQYFTVVPKGNGAIKFLKDAICRQNYCWYSSDNGVTWIDIKTNEIPLITNNKILIKSNRAVIYDWATYGIGHFSANTQFDVEGNIMSLTKLDNFADKTTIDKPIFLQLFSGCTGLTSAENLVLPSGPYNGMFWECSSLTKAPALLNKKISATQMFQGCSSLNNITCLAEDNIGGAYGTGYWVRGVSQTGTFYKKAGASWPSGDSGIPTGWTVVEV